MILDRLRELEERECLVGPIQTRPKDRGRGAPVKEILAAIADHGDAAALASAALDAKFAEISDLPWTEDDGDEEEARRELAELAIPIPVLKLPTEARAPRPQSRMVALAGDEKKAARLVVPLEKLVVLRASCERNRAILVLEVFRAPRQQKRPPRETFIEIEAFGDGLDDAGAPMWRARRTGAPKRRTDSSFRVGLPPRRNAYGCRFVTLTQPARPTESLADAIDRLEDALERLQRSQVWKAYVDGAVIRIEFELSTPEKRKERAAELAAEGKHNEARAQRASVATWWHVHAHILVWGRRWPQRTACLEPGFAGPRAFRCSCTRCAGVDNESSLLVTWRRALVETRRYAADLAGVDFGDGPAMAGGTRPWAKRARFNAAVLVESGEEAIVSRIRRYGHPRNDRTWARALVDVKIGGAHIKTPSRVRGGERLDSPWAALCEVVKYSTKAVALGSMTIERVTEVILATENRRLVRCTGILFGVDLEDGVDEPKVEAEGLEREAGVGEYALDDQGHVVDSDEFVWITPSDERFPIVLEERRAALERLHEFHERRRALRRAERESTGPPDRGRQRVHAVA